MIDNYVFLVLVKLTQIEGNAALVIVQIAANLYLLRKTLIVTDFHGLLSHVVQKDLFALLTVAARC